MGTRRRTCKDDDGKWDSCIIYPTMGSRMCDYAISPDPKDVGYCKGTSHLFSSLGSRADDRMKEDGRTNRNVISMERLMLLDPSEVALWGC
jgi:hypothetical protein